MNALNRLLYLGYYVKETDWSILRSFLRHVNTTCHIDTTTLVNDMLASSFRYNISFADYFYFRFWNKTHEEREQWAGTGFMYEYQKQMNPKPHRSVLQDKTRFLTTYKRFVHHTWATWEMLQQDPLLLYWFSTEATGKLVLKNAKGQCGRATEVIPSDQWGAGRLITYMRQHNYDLIESYIVQHKELMRLSPSGLNTVRIITQLQGDDVHILAARLRISVNSTVDNLAAGNLAAPVDIQTGTVTGNGVYSDITKSPVAFHPVTQTEIPGFQIPFWEEVIREVTQAASLYPYNRSVGWDIAVTDTGADFIEGNHNWCKLLWQLPVNRGLKHELLSFM